MFVQIRRLFAAFAALLFIIQPAYAQDQKLTIKGSPEAVAATEKLLVNAGGKNVWSQETFTVYERIYLQSGQVAQMRITRNLKNTTRRLEGRFGGTFFVQYIGEDEGWTWRNGNLTKMSAEDLSTEQIGLQQSLYYVYHRIANNDPALSLELVENGRRLNVHENEERLMCWFLLDGKGQQYSWGNIFKGEVAQHFYGPFEQMGHARLPAWGSSSNGGFRFEYVHSDFGLMDVDSSIPEGD